MTDPHCARLLVATEDLPTGTLVCATVHSIGGRSEYVTGTVVDHRRKAVVVQTDAHGRIVVPLSKIQAPRA